MMQNVNEGWVLQIDAPDRYRYLLRPLGAP